MKPYKRRIKESPELCKQKTAKAGDGTQYKYNGSSCEIAKCPTGKILDKGTGRCHNMAKEATLKEAGVSQSAVEEFVKQYHPELKDSKYGKTDEAVARIMTEVLGDYIASIEKNVKKASPSITGGSDKLAEKLASELLKQFLVNI